MIYIIDTETSGLGPTAGVCEIAWLKLDDNLNVIDEVCSLVNPETPIEAGAQAVHGISDDAVKGMPTLATFAPLFEQPLTAVGHNVKFDLRMLKSVLTPDASLCTLALARQALKDVTNHKLETLQKELGLSVQKSHSALGDVHTCRELLILLLDRLAIDFKTAVERQSQPKMLTRYTFGKYKGKAILSAPKSYRDWLLALPDLDKDLRYTLERMASI